MKTTLALALALALALPAGAAAPSLSQIGAAAAVRGAVKAMAPGAAVGRVIGSGKPLFLNDHVVTDADGRLQILLLDETVFTLGPNADMVLDEFVYDPATSAGKVSASISKGAFRFVTGQVARKTPENLKVKLAVGTIGVRGTVVVGETGPKGSLVINAGAAPGNNADEPASAIVVENAGRRTYSNRSGEGIRVLPDAPPAPPAEMHGDLDRINGILFPKPDRQAGRGAPEDSASKGSGHDKGKGRDLAASDIADLGQVSEGNALQTNANQQGFGVPNGNSDWSQIAKLTGTGSYSGNGTWTCSGGGCSGSSTFNFSLNTNFKSITGGSVQLITTSGLTGYIGPVNPSTSLLSGGQFPATGNATVSNTNSLLSYSNTNFNGTSFQFINSGGVAAKDVKASLTYFDSSSSISGTGSGTGTRP
ncbi:MAG: FecR domain-containing protein [Elusimicrobia bacterium]|nr:FecR domain-containing protein [Elusimicrobiota bacterium]